MKALVLAAGYGTRLKPLTDEIPKALVPLGGKPMLQRTIEHLIQTGVRELIINVHYRAEQVEDFIRLNKSFGIQIAFSDEREQILDTGGALLKAAWFFDDGEPFFVYNTDVLSDINLDDLYNVHLAHGNTVTLAVKDRPASRNLLFDKSGRLAGWRDNRSGEQKWVSGPVEEVTPLAYSGIQVVDPKIFSLITEVGAFPLIPVYLRLAGSILIGTYRHDANAWYDIGNKTNLEMAEQALRNYPGWMDFGNNLKKNRP